MLNGFAHTADVVDESVVNHMTDGSHWLGDGGFAVFWMVVMMVIIVIGIILLVKYFNESGNNKSPEEIVEKRYANGEITKKEYESLKKDLRK